MISFEAISPAKPGLTCMSRMGGCLTRATRVCSDCGAYLCDNEKCCTRVAVKELDGAPERLVCAACLSLS